MFKYDDDALKNTGRLLDDDDYYVICRFLYQTTYLFICIRIYIIYRVQDDMKLFGGIYNVFFFSLFCVKFLYFSEYNIGPVSVYI